MPSYEITGTYNGSQIERGLQNLESQIQKVAASMQKIQAPNITPKANFGSFFSEMDKAESYASKGSLSKMFSGVNLSGAGAMAGQSYASGMLGPLGGAASALGPAGLVAGAAIAGAAVIANAAYNAAAAWQSMKTSIGRTTGLQGTELENMMNDLQALRMEMGMTAQSAADAAEQAGSIGVGQKKFQAGDMAAYRKEIMDFVSSASMISGAWGMSNAATTEGIGAMGSVTLDNWNRQRKAMGEQEMSWSDFALKSGASVDALANSMKASEEQIVTAMTHASGSIAEFAPSEDTIGKWYALSSYLISTGASADGAGEQIKDMATYISRDAKGAISGLLGTDTAGLMAKMKADSVGTIQELGKAIAQMPDSERPDIYAAFGMTGSQGMKKIVADIENETGALDLAIDIGVKGFKTGDVKKGFDAVLAEANTQAGRIAQVFQVALEKVGTIALPAITAGMKTIADVGEGTVNMVSDWWGAGSERVGAAQKTLESGFNPLKLFEDVTGITSAWEASAKEGTQKGVSEGAKKGFEDSKGAAKDAGSEAGKAAAEEFAKANDDYAKAHPNGYSVVGEKIIGGSDSRSSLTDTSTEKISSLLDTYILQKSYEKGGETGLLSILSSSGEVLKSKSYLQAGSKASPYGDLDAVKKELEDAIKPVILDMPKYLKSASSSISSSLSDILSDGVINFTEKGELESYLETLNSMKDKYPVEFEAVGLPSVQREIENALMGKTYAIKIKPDFGELETNLQLWLSENSGLWEKMASVGVKPTQSDAESLHSLLTGIETKKGETSDEATVKKLDREAELIKNLIDASTKGDVASMGVAHASLDELLAMDSTFAENKGIQMLAATLAQEQVSQLVVINGTLLSIGNSLENGKFASASSIINNYGDFSKVASGQWAGNLTYGTQSGYSVAKTASGSLFDVTGVFGKLQKFASGGYVSSGGLAIVGEKEPEYIIPESMLAKSKYYSDQYWAQDELDSRLKITAPVSAFQSSLKSGTVPVMTSGNPVLNPWTDKPILNEDYLLQLQAKWSGNSLVKPSSGVANPSVVNYAAELAAHQKANQEVDKFADVTDKSFKNLLPWNDKIIQSTAEQDTYCEATGAGRIALEEFQLASSKNALYQKSYIGPSNYYDAFKAYSAGDPNYQKLLPYYSAIEANTEKTASETQKVHSTLSDVSGGTKRQESVLSKALAGSTAVSGDLTIGGGVAKKIQGSLTEFDAFEEGLKSCIQYMSDWGVAQEGVLSGDLFSGGFEGGYIGGSQYYDASKHGAATGYEDKNFLSYYPTSQPFYEEAQSRGLMGLGQSEDKTAEKVQSGIQQLNSYAAKTGSTLLDVSQNGNQLVGEFRSADNSLKSMSVDISNINDNTSKLTGTMTGGALVAGVSAGVSDWFSKAGSINGGGSWLGSWGTSTGMSGSTYYGSTATGAYAASGGSSGWGGAASSGVSGGFGGSQGWGSVSWAKGGLVNTPTFFQDASGNMNVVGETFEPELILPLNDRRRTMELINANIPMARRFANGGMVGGGNVSAAFGGVTLHYAPVINGSGLSEAALRRVLRKERKDTLEQVEAKLYRDRKR